MAELKINQEPEEKRKLKGLVDGGKVHSTCINCGKSLMDFQLVQPQAQAEVLTRVVVKCGFCGGHSAVEQLAGQFYPGAANDDINFDVADNDTEIECDVYFKAWSKCK